MHTRDVRKTHAVVTFLRPVPGLAKVPTRYPRLCAVDYYLSPFGLSRLPTCPASCDKLVK